MNQKYSRDELIEVLRRHLHAYKDDEKFAQHVMDMAAFLVEYRAYKRRHMPETSASDTAEQRLRWLRSTEQRDEELKVILDRYDRRGSSSCKLCGAPTDGHVMCPNCGNMAV